MSQLNKQWLLVVLLVAASASAGPHSNHKNIIMHGDKNVISLNAANFERTLDEHENLLVFFYAPWCTHCQNLHPLYNAAANLLAEEEPTMKIAKMDAEKYRSIAQKHGVTSYPTLKLFRYGEFFEDFTGPDEPEQQPENATQEGENATSSEDGEKPKEEEKPVEDANKPPQEGGPPPDKSGRPLVDWVKKKYSVVTVHEVNSSSEMKGYVNNVAFPVIVGLFGTKECVDFKYFKAVTTAISGSGMEVYYSSDNAVLEAFGFLRGGSSVQLYRPKPAKPTKLTFKGKIFKHTLREWIVENSLLDELLPYTPHNKKLFEIQSKPVIRIMTREPRAKLDLEYLNGLRQLNPDVRFALAERDDFADEFTSKCGEDEVVCVLAHDTTKRIYRYKGDYHNGFELSKFINDLKDRKLRSTLKSDAPPSTIAKEGTVITVVGDTFNEIVMGDKKRDVFIDFHAPWCGHCEKLDPIWEQIAAEFDPSRQYLVMAKMNIESNDIPPEHKKLFNVSSLPSMYLVRKSDKRRPIDYGLQKTVKDIARWLIPNMTKLPNGKFALQEILDKYPPEDPDNPSNTVSVGNRGRGLSDDDEDDDEGDGDDDDSGERADEM